MYNLQCPDEPRDTPGTLAYRGNKQRIWDYRMRNYKLPVRALDWATDRETEPKDYDFQKDPKKNIFRSTYNQIGYYEKDWRIPKPTTQELQECAIKTSHPKCRIPQEDMCKILLTRQTLERAKENIIPSDRHKMYLLSTYRCDYKRRHPVVEEPPGNNRWEKLVEAGAFRRCKPGTRTAGVQKWLDLNPLCPFRDLKEEISVMKKETSSMTP